MKTKLLIIGLAAVAAYNEWGVYHNGKIAKSVLKENVYLAAKLDSNGIPMTEFDKIALANLK